MSTGRADALLEFWFGDALASPERLEARSQIWFRQSDDFDAEIRERFGALPERAEAGELDAWRGEAESCLAFVLAVDQLPRNLFRGSARAFAFDALAREAAVESIGRGFDRDLHPVRAAFLYLPLEHAEDVELQERCVELYAELAERVSAELRPRFEEYSDYARRHRDVIRRFGRFPHRNRVLERPSSPEEDTYLESGGDAFG
jgi:uncharacterized protein (DUF924 family)